MAILTPELEQIARQYHWSPVKRKNCSDFRHVEQFLDRLRKIVTPVCQGNDFLLKHQAGYYSCG
jgi:hypothetical protein